jgi:3-hydroxybutyrate dehydrogenase
MMPERPLAGRTAIITGSVAGLGNAIASRLAADGANIVLNGLEPVAEGIESVKKIALEHAVEALFDSADLSDLSQIERMVDNANTRFGGIDILVNNAVVRNFAAIEDIQPEAWDLSIAVNLSAAFHAVRLILPGMKARRWGRIINMSSVYGWRGAAGRIDYVTTKTALIGLTRGIAVETASSGVTANALSPGSVPTPAIMSKLESMAEAQGTSLAEVEKSYISERHPTGRFVAMKNVAAMVSFLCSSAGDDITGTVLPIDGGWTVS